MFTIYGSKTSFSQWEKDQRVVNPNMTDCEQVAFRMSNGRTGVSRAYEHEGQMVADVPNHLLKYSGNMMVELGQGKNLRIEETTYFPVTKTSKPEEYEETENRNLKKKYIETVKQDLTEAEKEQARENLGINGSGGGATTWDELEGKPFGVTEGEDVFLPQDTRLTYSTQTQSFMGEVVSVPNIGTICTVTYNGVCYEVIAKEFMAGQVALGNLAMAGLEDTGEPFAVIMHPDDNTVMVAPLDGTTELVIEIKGYVKYTKKLDETFYNAPCVYYAKTIHPGNTSINYIYTDKTHTNKVTLPELGKAKGKPVVIIYSGDYYYATALLFGGSYGRVDTCFVNHSDASYSAKYIVFYTAEYEG